MRLRDLDASFVGEVNGSSSKQLSDVDGAQGIMFQCPKCAQGKEVQEKDGERFVIGVHYVLCWFSNPRNAEKVPISLAPTPGRWQFEGNSIDDITFIGPDAASVLLFGGCSWHGFIRNGDASVL